MILKRLYLLLGLLASSWLIMSIIMALVVYIRLGHEPTVDIDREPAADDVLGEAFWLSRSLAIALCASAVWLVITMYFAFAKRVILREAWAYSLLGLAGVIFNVLQFNDVYLPFLTHVNFWALD